MTFTEIETFLTIVQTKSITKTAESLFLTQPTVSHRLKSLETELNMQLISRKKGYKTVELTSKGEEFIPYAERWLSLWKETKMLENSQEKMYLTVGAIDTLNSGILSNFYEQLLTNNPSLGLEVRTHQSYEIYSLLEKHDVSIGFVFHHLYFKNIISEPLFKESLYIVQPYSPFVEKKHLHTEELDSFNELYFNWDSNYQIWHNQWIDKLSKPVLQVDTFQMLLHFMQTGNYWMIAPTSVVRKLLEYDSWYISKITNKPAPPKRVTYRIHHKIPSSSSAKAVTLFNEALTEYLSHIDLEELDVTGPIKKR